MVTKSALSTRVQAIDHVEEALAELEAHRERMAIVSGLFRRSLGFLPKGRPRGQVAQQNFVRERDGLVSLAAELRQHSRESREWLAHVARLTGGFDVGGGNPALPPLALNVNASEKGDYPSRHGEVLENLEDDDGE